MDIAQNNVQKEMSPMDMAKNGQFIGDFMEYNIGNIVRTKKQHPCGSKLWEITRVGVDFKLKCQGCGHIVVLPREKALKIITKKIEDFKD